MDMSELAEKITESELEVLEVLWQADKPLSVTPIRMQLETERGWEASTVKTLLRRLCDKGVVAAKKREVFYYRPLLDREEYRRWSVRSLLNRIFRGSARDLIASLVEEDQLSEADLQELREMLYAEEEQDE